MASPVRHWQNSDLVVRSLLIGAVTIIAGGGFVWLSTAFDSPVTQAVLSNVGTAILTTGLIGVAYEGFIKNGLLNDVRRAQRVSQDIVDSGLTQIVTDLQKLQYLEIFQEASEIDIMPHAPMTWSAQNMSWVIGLATRRRVKFRVFFPDPGLYSRALRERSVGEAEDALTSRDYCAACAREIVRSWDRSSAGLTNGSALQTVQFTGYPHSGFIVGGGAVVIITPSAQGPDGDTQVIASVFQGPRAGQAKRWVERTICNLRQVVVIDQTESNVESAPDEILPLSRPADAAVIRTSPITVRASSEATGGTNA